MGKKGSLSLSVNAIVVLVLAMVMLGLGISFTKGMFGRLGDDLISKADYTEVPNPTANDPVSTLPARSVEPGSSDVIPIKIFNSRTSEATFTVEVECPESITINNDLDYKVSIPPKKIGQIAVPFSVDETFSSAVTVCNIKVKADGAAYGSTIIQIKLK
ncbi:MAG: hypothetical protein QW594_02245 [Candidatus Woesearchaeota archaeon]